MAPTAVASAAAGGSELYRLLEGRDTRWYNGRLLLLNAIMVLLLITSMTNGYDGSMMNGLQTLDQWVAYFGTPTGGTLGLFNAIQVSVSCRAPLRTAR